jgi:hypothetical protein
MHGNVEIRQMGMPLGIKKDVVRLEIPIRLIRCDSTGGIESRGELRMQRVDWRWHQSGGKTTWGEVGS